MTLDLDALERINESAEWRVDRLQVRTLIQRLREAEAGWQRETENAKQLVIEGDRLYDAARRDFQKAEARLAHLEVVIEAARVAVRYGTAAYARLRAALAAVEAICDALERNNPFMTPTERSLIAELIAELREKRDALNRLRRDFPHVQTEPKRANTL